MSGPSRALGLSMYYINRLSLFSVLQPSKTNLLASVGVSFLQSSLLRKEHPIEEKTYLSTPTRVFIEFPSIIGQNRVDNVPIPGYG
jgi:hypothetical protein